MSDFPITMIGHQPECYVFDGEDCVGEFASEADAIKYMVDTHERQERMGEPRSYFRYVPVRAMPGGKDIR